MAASPETLTTFETLAVGDTVTLRFEPIWVNRDGSVTRKYTLPREREYSYRGIDAVGDAHFTAVGGSQEDAVDPDEIVAWFHDVWERYVTGEGKNRSEIVFSERSACVTVVIPEAGIDTIRLCGSREPGDLVKLRLSHPDQPTVFGERVVVYEGSIDWLPGSYDSVVNFTYLGSHKSFQAKRLAGQSRYQVNDMYVEEAYEEPGEIRP